MKKSIYQKELDEMHGIQNKLKPDKKKKNKKGKNELGETPVKNKNILQRFNDQQAKGSVQNTLLKTIADIAGIGIGTMLSAATGTVAPAVGAVLIGAGHYVGDESGLLRVVGASTLAHSVSKAKAYRGNPNQTLAERFSELKDDWLIATLIKHYEQNQPTAVIPNSQPNQTPSTEVQKESKVPAVPSPIEQKSEEQKSEVEQSSESETELDLTGLEQFEHFNEESADEFEQAQNSNLDFMNLFDPESSYPNESLGFNYSKWQTPDYDSDKLMDQDDFSNF